MVCQFSWLVKRWTCPIQLASDPLNPGGQREGLPIQMWSVNHRLGDGFGYVYFQPLLGDDWTPTSRLSWS